MAISPEAYFKLTSVTPTNQTGRSGYSLSLSGGALTTPILFGQLSSAIVNSATLTIPVTRKFGLSFLSKPNDGTILSFGRYRVDKVLDRIVVSFVDEAEGTTELGSVFLDETRVMRYSFSFDGTAVSLRVDYTEITVNAPAEEEVSTITLLQGGGLLDSVYYWSTPITSYDHNQIVPLFPDLDQSDFLNHISVDELYLPPFVTVLETGASGSFDPDATGWVPTIAGGSTLVANGVQYYTGESIPTVPDTVDVIGTVAIAEFTDASIESNPLVNIQTDALGTSRFVHPMWRSDNVGTRGGVVLDVKDDVTTPATISFWMDPMQGTIMPGVTMAAGVVTGASYINGKAYSGTVLRDRFMVTVNRAFTDLTTINADITNLYTNTVASTQVAAQALYESFFTPLTITVPSDSLTVGNDNVFVIDATWGIVISG